MANNTTTQNTATTAEKEGANIMEQNTTIKAQKDGNSIISISIPTINKERKNGATVNSIVINSQDVAIGKGAKITNLEQFVKDTQLILLDTMKTNTDNSITALNEKEQDSKQADSDTEFTEEDREKRETLKDLLNCINTQLEKVQDGNKNNTRAQVLSAVLLGAGVNFAVSGVLDDLRTAYTMTYDAVTSLYNGDSVQLTAEQQKALTKLKQGIKTATNPYCGEVAKTCEKFNLSISNKHVINFVFAMGDTLYFDKKKGAVLAGNKRGKKLEKFLQKELTSLLWARLNNTAYGDK